MQAGDKIAWSLLSNGTVVVRPKTRRLVDRVGMLTRPGQPGHRRRDASAGLSAAIDTEVLVRVIVRDPTAAAQCAAAKCVVAEASASGEPLLITPCAML